MQIIYSKGVFSYKVYIVLNIESIDLTKRYMYMELIHSSDIELTSKKYKCRKYVSKGVSQEISQDGRLPLSRHLYAGLK